MGKIMRSKDQKEMLHAYEDMAAVEKDEDKRLLDEERRKEMKEVMGGFTGADDDQID